MKRGDVYVISDIVGLVFLVPIAAVVLPRVGAPGWLYVLLGVVVLFGIVFAIWHFKSPWRESDEDWMERMRDE